MHLLGKWRYKEKPEDFIVEEVIDLQELKRGKDYAWYVMEKENLTTLQGVTLVASRSGISRREIFWAGEKDKHAITRQFIAIRRRALKPLGERPLDQLRAEVNLGNLKGRVSLRFVTWSAQPPKQNMIKLNRFKVKIYGPPFPGFQERFEKAVRTLRKGFLNYYDKQRFGSRGINHIVGYLLLKNKPEEALKLFLTYLIPEETKKVRRYRRKILREWDREGLQNLVESLPLEMDMERTLLRAYLKSRDPLEAFRSLPKKILKMFLNALQSFSFNLTLAQRVRETLLLLREVSLFQLRGNYERSSLLNVDPIMRDLNLKIALPVSASSFSKLQEELESLSLPLPGVGTELPHWFPREKLLDFKLMGTYRKALEVPENFTGDFQEEGGEVSVTLEFSLPKGTYATMLMRHFVSILR